MFWVGVVSLVAAIVGFVATYVGTQWLRDENRRLRALIPPTREWLRLWLHEDSEDDFTNHADWPAVEERLVAAIDDVSDIEVGS